MNGFCVWDLRNDRGRYGQYVNRCVDATPYHFTEYLLAESKAENGITRIFCYEEGGHFAMLPEVVRRINDLPYMGGLEEDLYDMMPPHEYGGIVSDSHDDALKHKLLQHISRYCNENNIIFQFIRINPYLKGQPLIFRENGFEVTYSNAQVYVDLNDAKERIIAGYTSDVRRNIKRAEREGLSFEIADKNQKNIRAFQTIYKKAMKVLEARTFLYFNDEYFRELMECDCSRLVLVRNGTGAITAGSIMLSDSDTVYYHLSCFDRDCPLKSSMNYLVHSMVSWAKENGYKTLHLAGGHRSLLQFKEGYSKTRVDYYVASHICDKEKYSAVCEKWKKQFPEYAGARYLPLYRYNE